jgi:ABC-type lipoprotein release transport system permease subunit
MITRTAWRNVWRNRIRSIVVIASVTVGIFAGIFAVAVMNGAINQRLQSALEDEISHIQVTSRNFRANNDIEYTIANSREIADQIDSLPGTEAVSSHIVVMGMAATATGNAGVEINGVDPEKERSLSGLPVRLKEGTGEYLKDNQDHNYAYIGVDLAKSLHIIRYEVTAEMLSQLSDEGVPDEVVEKLSSYEGERFKNEKLFRRAVEKVLSESETDRYGSLITTGAENFRERARITLTFFDMMNHQTGGVFRIAGLYDIPNNMFEASQVFVTASTLQRLSLVPDGEAHRIYIKLKEREDTDDITSLLSEKYPELEVMSWKQLAPDLQMTEAMATMMYGFFMAIILAALAFGIVNTMLMVVLERTKELGMLAAIGMNKKKVFRMIMTESVFLSFTGGITGMILSVAIILRLSERGINFSTYQEGFEAMGYSSHIYPEIGAGFFLLTAAMIIATGVLSSIYPALRALKTNPADALRTE